MAGNGEKIGNAYLEVVPELSPNFGSDLASKGSTHGEQYGGSFSSKMQSAVGAGAVALGNILANLSQQAAAAVGKFIGDSIQVGANFESSMSQVAATMGTTVNEIQDLSDFAQEMGASTAFSANQAAEALNYMALAGYSTEQSMAALPNVLNLAAAGNIELARASDMVTDAQSALGLSFEDLDGFVDQLAKTSSTTNTNVEQLGDAILTVGGTAKMLSGGTRELNQVLGILADNSIKGSEGGTALRNILLSLSAPTDAAAKMLDDLGVSVFDAEGNMRSLEDVMADFNEAMDGMTSEERTNAISTIFNKRDLRSVEALLGTNAQRWNEVGDAIDNAHGAAEQMAKTKLDNLLGDVTLFQSALATLQIKLFDGVAPALRVVVEAATNGITAIQDFFTGGGVNELFSGLADVWVDIQAIAQEVWPSIEKTITGVVDVIKNVFNVVWPFVSAIVSHAFNTIRGITEIVWPIVSALVETAIARIQSVINGLAPIIEFITDLFNGIKSAIETPINAAKEIVHNAIEAIKSFFSFKIQWPHIPLPHFTISGSVNPLDWISEGVPHIGIEWYAKGGFVDGATLIGAGEKGAEMILPRQGAMMDEFAERVSANGDEELIRWLAANLGHIINEYTPVISKREFDRLARGAIA